MCLLFARGQTNIRIPAQQTRFYSAANSIHPFSKRLPALLPTSCLCLLTPCASSLPLTLSLSYPRPTHKVDADAVAEARQAREAENDIVAVRALREELSARGLAAVPADGAASVSAAAAAVVDLEGGVAAAVAAKPETMTAELARLRGELAAAGKLAAKVEALERANARLMVEVADLRKEPSLEEIKLRADREAARCVFVVSLSCRVLSCRILSFLSASLFCFCSCLLSRESAVPRSAGDKCSFYKGGC